MAQITWQTTAGDLGTYAEGIEFSKILDASNSLASNLTFRVITGKLPPGIQLYRDGRLYGIPVVTQSNSAVAQKYSFTVRASNVANQIADRTFSISINSIIPPTLDTGENLGTFYDNDPVNIRLLYTEINPEAKLTWSVVNGSLPTGLTLSQTGHISGFALAPPAAGPAGSAVFDVGAYDEFVWDFEGAALSRSYSFRVRLYDGIQYVDRQYKITILAKSFFLVDNANITADSSFTADEDGYEYPVILTDPGALADVRANRQYAFKFDYYFPNPNIKVHWRTVASNGIDTFDNSADPYDIVGFDQDDLNLPVGLALDRETGWLTGSIGTVTAHKNVYTFQVIAFIEVPISATAVSVRESKPVKFTLTILDAVDNLVVWNTANDLGIIDNGRISTLAVSAVATKAGVVTATPLTYSIKSGQYNRLPQGLSLLPSGHIAGRTTFDFFSMDRSAMAVVVDGKTTTFDSSYTFTVLAESADGIIFDTRTFTLKVRNVNSKPFENLSIPAFLPQRLRDTFRTSLSSVSSIDGTNTDVIYRADDPWFGVAKEFKFLAQVGLRPNLPSEYMQAMELFHRNKQIRFSGLKWAVALDDNYKPKYEVVYFEVEDYNTVAAGAPGTGKASNARFEDDGDIFAIPASAVDLLTIGQNTTVAEDYGSVLDSLTKGTALSGSNSFGNMTNEIVTGIGYNFQGALPEWMQSIQPDTGQALGFVRAVVLAYCNPGFGQQLKFRYINNQTSSGVGVLSLINQYSFTADRYRLDRALTVNYNTQTESFKPARTATFDRIPSIGQIDYGPWTSRQTGTSLDIFAVDYGNGEYIAAGSGATLLTSLSGETWTAYTQTTNLTYRAGLSTNTAASSSTLNFAYGVDFSAGDRVLDTSNYSFGAATYITDVAYSAGLNTALVGAIPANTSIEFIDFNNVRQSLLLTQAAAPADTKLSFGNISLLQRGHGLQIAGIDTANACQVTTNISNIVTLNKPLTNLIATGTTVTFNDLRGNVVSLLTTTTAIAGATQLHFADTSTLTNNPTYVTLANIAQGTGVTSLNTTLTVSNPSPTALPQGLEILFQNVISSNSNAGDVVINLSSTDRIGIGSAVFGSAITSTSLSTATWLNIFDPGISTVITVPTADILGIQPFVGMTVSANSLPKNSIITSIVPSGVNTLIAVTFPAVAIATTTHASTSDSQFALLNGTVIPTSSNVASVVVNSISGLSLGDYVTSGNISFNDQARITKIFSGNNTIIVTPTPTGFGAFGNSAVIHSGETLAFQTAKYGNPVRIASAVSSGTLATPDVAFVASDVTKIYLNDLVTGPNIALNEHVKVTNVYGNGLVTVGPTIKTVTAGDVFTFQTAAALIFDLPQLVDTGTTVIAKTPTSVTLSSPLKAALDTGSDNAIKFGLSTAELYDVNYTNGKFIIVGSGGIVITRDSFKNWTQTTSIPYGDLYSIVYGNGVYVGVGSEGVVTTTTDLVNWTVPAATPARGILRSIDYYAGQFIAVGEGGVIITSTDNGVHWTLSNSPVGTDLNAVRFVNGQWTVVGQQGVVLLSLDGVTWNQFDTGVTDTLHAVTYVNNHYIAVGTNGVIVDSEDGTSWFRRDSNVKNTLLGITKSASTPVIAGKSGLLLSESNYYTVQWAIRNISYELINNRNLVDLRVLGYSFQAGDTLIWAQQEGFDATQFRGGEFINDGWNQYTDVFGTATDAGLFDSSPFDRFTIVPGFLEHSLDANTTNKRAGIWQVNIDSNNIVSLSFVRQIQLNQIITVVNDGDKLVYNPVIQPGNSVPAYTGLNKVLNSTTGATVFDTNGTRFSSPRDVYISDPSSYDQYLKFPQIGLHT